MAYSIKWSPKAVVHFEGICDYIARDSRHYAALFARKILSLVKAIPQFPKAGNLNRATSLEKIEGAMKQSEKTSDQMMRIDLIRDALKSALKGLEYLPNDDALKIQADLAERRLKFLT